MEQDLEKQPHHEPTIATGDEDASSPEVKLSRQMSNFEYPSTKKAAVIMISIYLTVFLVALDRTIIGTAIPAMTNEFHSFDDIGWYGSSYMMTACAFQLVYGRIYTFYSPKWVFMSAIALFEIGSAVCGAAPNSTAFIIGRAISGLGCSGIFSGAITIMMNVLPLQQRPKWMGLNGAVFAIASVVGPLLGGVFTSKVTWRWCFYINLPIGAVSVAVVLLVLKVDAPMAAAGKSLREKLLQLDPVGTMLFLPSIVCLLLALQWGGAQYSWSDGRVIALLVVFAALILAFAGLQVWHSDAHATIPTRIITQRSIAAGLWYTVCVGGSFGLAIYYLPIWFQAIKGVDAIQSGIRTIPLVLALVVAAMAAGLSVSKLCRGYYTPFLLAASVVMPIGTGLLTTFTPGTGSGAWIGYQVLLGLGIGLGMQQANLAAQTVLPRADVASGTSLMFFGQSLGGAVFLSVGQNVLSSRLIANLRGAGFRLGAQQIVNAGATDIRRLVPEDQLPSFLQIYNDAITKGVFLVALVLACLAFFGAAAMEWRSVNAARKAPAAAAENQSSFQNNASVGKQEEEVEVAA